MARTSLAHALPRPPSDNLFRLSLRIPLEWAERAKALIPKIRQSGMLLTLTDVLRMAVSRGLDVLEEEARAKEKGGKKR